MRLIRLAAGLCFFVALTLLTPIGGLVLLLSVALLALWRNRLPRQAILRGAAGLVLFIFLYTLTQVFVVPPLAAMGGCECLSCFPSTQEPVRARSPVTCLLGRNYVRPETRRLVQALAHDM